MNMVFSVHTSLLLLICFTYATSSDLYGDNVVRYDEPSFKHEIGKTPHFVKFFAPWCGHCKRLAPTWDELAEKYNTDTEKQKVVIAKVDCTTDTSLCAEQDVTGYPTLKFFKAGTVEGFKYRGPRDISSLEAFISQSLGEAEETPKKDDTKPPEAINGLVELTDESFHKAVARGNHFVKFYAPWCGHCQKLAPVWEGLAASFQHDHSVKISKVDCTVQRMVCNEFEVKAYPSLFWIVDGKKIEKYEGSRTHEGLKEFVNQMLSRRSGHQDAGIEDGRVPDTGSEGPAPVLLLIKANFETAISQGVTFVKFFAPWCGHCRRLAPTWDDLGRKFVASTKVKIAKVDCTSEEELCNQYKVQGYPTLILFRNGEQISEYNGARDLESLHTFVSEYIQHDEL